MALNAILLIGSSTGGKVVGINPLFGLLVEVMYVALLTSSLLLSYYCRRQNQTIWAILFLTNVFIVLIPSLLKFGGLITKPNVPFRVRFIR